VHLGLGGRVAIVSCGSDDLDRACATALRDEGAHVVAGGSPGELVDEAVRRHGRVDILVVGAEAAPGASIDGATVDELFTSWDAVVGSVDAYQRALGSMIPNGWGRFVQIASSAAKSVTEDVLDLDAMEGLSILALHKVVANEFGGRGITANTVLRAPRVDPVDVAAAVAFLASERAAYLTGLAVAVDAGTGASIY
jgi:3-oxoacyl-[acyl-carrier protein] reductase